MGTFGAIPPAANMLSMDRCNKVATSIAIETTHRDKMIKGHMFGVNGMMLVYVIRVLRTM